MVNGLISIFWSRHQIFSRKDKPIYVIHIDEKKSQKAKEDNPVMYQKFMMTKLSVFQACKFVSIFESLHDSSHYQEMGKLMIISIDSEKLLLKFNMYS